MYFMYIARGSIPDGLFENRYIFQQIVLKTDQVKKPFAIVFR